MNWEEIEPNSPEWYAMWETREWIERIAREVDELGLRETADKYEVSPVLIRRCVRFAQHFQAGIDAVEARKQARKSLYNRLDDSGKS